MENQPNNSGATPQREQPSADPSATRYFPAQQNYAPPGVATPPTAAQGGQYALPPQQGYAPPGTAPNTPSTGAYAPPQANGVPPYQPMDQVHNVQSYPHSVPGARREPDRTLWALVLIGGGILFLLEQLFGFEGFGGLVLMLLGGIFMYAYANTNKGHRIGFLIPGAILSGLGVGVLLSEISILRFWGDGSLVPLTLGLGFCLIWFLERKHWWALIPGGILVLASLPIIGFIGVLWPLALIAVGAYLLYDQSRRQRP